MSCQPLPVTPLAIPSALTNVVEHLLDLHRVRSAPFPASVAKLKATAQIDALADAGEPYTAGVVEHLGPVVFPTTQIVAQVYNVDAAPAAVAIFNPENVLGVIAFLLRDQLKAKICALIDQDADDAAALGEQERAQREATIASDILAVERQEAVLIFEAQRSGLSVEFRSDTNPLAILGLDLITIGRAAPSDGTSPEHAGWRR
jgi:hypothetical protein